MKQSITITAEKNPIIRRMGVCDPHLHAFNGKMYMYNSHDAVPGSEPFITRDWLIWSSDDCVNWKLESVLKPEDLFMGKSDRCWAVDCAERDGKYYLYYSDGSERVGVAVSDNPGGPFHEALGRPLLDGTLTPTAEYDPCVFRDDDGDYYILFGGPCWAYGKDAGYYIARLNEDMVSLAEAPKKIELDHDGDDKVSLNKFNGRYYLSYGGFYAISNNVYGPYSFVGHSGSSIDHTSFCEWNGQLFHGITVLDYYNNYRSSGIVYAHLRENGEIVVDPLIMEYGVGQYDSDWNRIEAEWFMSGKNIRKVENSDYCGFSVACSEKAVLTFPKIRNLENKKGFALFGDWVGGGKVELREKNEDGNILGVLELKYEVHRFNDAVFNWRNRRRSHLIFDKALADNLDLCLVVKPDPGAEIRIDHFHFFAEPCRFEDLINCQPEV